MRLSNGFLKRFFDTEPSTEMEQPKLTLVVNPVSTVSTVSTKKGVLR
ncbi:hypothetical protein BMETH_25152413801865, partial [methanotrophic bacterial endosymbiont of Bathymodiolus sp.]